MFELCRLSARYNFYTTAHSVGQKKKKKKVLKSWGILAQLLSEGSPASLFAWSKREHLVSFLCAGQISLAKVKDLGWPHGCFSVSLPPPFWRNLHLGRQGRISHFTHAKFKEWCLQRNTQKRKQLPSAGNNVVQGLCHSVL